MGVGGADDGGEFLDEMDEIEIDLSTPEGQALLKELTESGAIEIDEHGEQIDSGTAVSGRAEPGAPEGQSKRRFTRGDLSVEGAVGPETHAYGGMAVHLYMKRRGGV